MHLRALALQVVVQRRHQVVGLCEMTVPDDEDGKAGHGRCE
jgi:hypothetical protein